MENKKLTSKELLKSILEISYENNRNLNLSLANKLAKRAIKKAELINIKIVVSILDSGGNLILLNRMDNSFLGSIDVSINKAYTALSFNIPTHLLKKLVEDNGELHTLENSNKGKIIAFGGGYPIKINKKLLGGIGISGGSVKEDTEIVEYALEIINEIKMEE